MLVTIKDDTIIAAVAADICAHITPLPIRGVIWLAPLPWIGEILPIVATPEVLAIIPGLVSPDNTDHAFETRLTFCRQLVSPKWLPSVPFKTFTSWLGQSIMQSPMWGSLLLGRKQDQTRLLEEAGKGLPFVVISGTDDCQINGKKIEENMKPVIKDWEFHLLDGVGHTPFWEEPKSCVEIILKFVVRVNNNTTQRVAGVPIR
jgi:pimeloyl-ACP methyl ester carboxylesterase